MSNSESTENDDVSLAVNDKAEAIETQIVAAEESSEAIGDNNLDESESETDNETVGNTTFETTYDTGESGDEHSESDMHMGDQSIVGDDTENMEEDIENTQEEAEDRCEDEGEDEDDEPPKLKYTRLNGLPANFFSKDPVSCCNFHESYFIFATHSGIVHITKPDYTTVRTFKAHRASILSIYTDGQFFATGSMDGTIVIGAIEDEKDIIAYDFKRPIHAVVLDNNYGRTRSFISGGMSGKVIYSSKNWLGQRSDAILDENNGPVVGIHTIDDIVIWMNDKGISIFHIPTRQVIKVINKPEGSPRSDLYWPKVHSLELDRILIGWANYIWCLRFSIRTSEDKVDVASNKSRILPSAATISFRAVQEKKVEIDHVFKLSSLIAGIASFKDDYWMILSYEPPTTDENGITFNNPDLKLINSLTGEVDFEEEIGLKNIENLGLNDYSLSRHIGLDVTSYFIVSAKDAVIAQEVQLTDRLDWFMSKEKYKEAWTISQHLVTPLKRINIGIRYVDELINQDNWHEAALFLKDVLYIDANKLPDGDTRSTILTTRSNKTITADSYDDEFIKSIIEQWESWSSILIKAGHIEELTEIIPDIPKLTINQNIYNEILTYWVGKDTKKTIELIAEWDNDLYDVKKIENLIESYLESNESKELRKCLVEVYVHNFEPQKAVSHLVDLKDHDLVLFLSEHHLLTMFINDLPKIIKLRFEDNEFETLPLETLRSKLKDIINILVDHRHEISTEDILKMMDTNRMNYISYLYLEELKEVDEFLLTTFGNKRVQLYSDFDRAKLLPYLMKSSDYDIDYAIKICETSDFTEELVYLLGKIGENKRALMLIIDKLDNPEIAINFAKHQNDKEAWNILLEYSMSKPRFIKALIETADDQSNPFYDPISIFEKIPSNIKIEGLKASVSNITENNELTYLINQLILGLIYNSSESISKDYRSNLLKGFEIETTTKEFEKNFLHELKTILVFNDKVGMEPALKSQKDLFPDLKLIESIHKDIPSKVRHLELLTEYLHKKK